MRKRLPLVFVMVGILATLGPGVSARNQAEATPQKITAPKQKALVGSWVETVTFPPESGRPPLKSLVSFHADETMVASDQGGVTTDPPFAQSSGHGVWTHLKQRTFAYSVRYLFSDLSGNLQAYLRVRGVYTVSESGNEYNGTSSAEVLDTDGNVLFSIEVTNAGERIQLELP